MSGSTIPLSSRSGEAALASGHALETLANCATWISWCNAANATEAKANIYETELKHEDRNDPHALISVMQTQMQRDSSSSFNHGGTIKIRIESFVPANQKDDDAGDDVLADPAIWFHDQITAIEAEFYAQGNTPGRLHVDSISHATIERTTHERRRDRGDTMMTEIMVTWT